MIELRVQPGLDAAAGLMQVKQIAWRFPGVERLTILVPTSDGERRLDLGPFWTYDGSPACIAALSEFGEVVSPHGDR